MNDLGHVFKMINKKGEFLEVDFRKETPQDVDKYTNLGGWTYHEIFESKDYEIEKCFIQKGDIVVDAGANLGFFTVYAGLKGASKIYSFEPDVKNFECLKQNAPPQAKLFNLGLMAWDGEFPFYVDVNPGGHSFFNYGETKTGEIRRIQCLSIPSLFEKEGLDKIDFLKMDIEGPEIEILGLLPREYFPKIRNIVFEYHNMSTRKNSLDILIKRLSRWYDGIVKNKGYLSLIYLWEKINKTNLPS